MADLRGALMAAAQEAEKMQEEFQTEIDTLRSHIQYVESENTKLKNKLVKAAALLNQFAEILTENENY
jgi:uncharacterized membrane protein